MKLTTVIGDGGIMDLAFSRRFWGVGFQYFFLACVNRFPARQSGFLLVSFSSLIEFEMGYLDGTDA